MALRPSVNQLRKLGNFTQMFRWGIKFVTLPKALRGYSTLELNARALSASVPEKTGTTTEIQIRGNKVRQAGIVEYTSPWTCTLMETTDVYVQRMLRDWHNLYWDTDKVAIASSGLTQYKVDMEGIIELVHLDNMDKPIYCYTLIGAYPEGYPRGDFDGSTADPMQPAISFAFDYFTEKALSAAISHPSDEYAADLGINYGEGTDY